ncbi:MAG TPA: ABC transporter substrate-binding protein [Chthoniobacterales bacterium]|nr:ABC transporter substrate-binding protein [Chthoniobacterales bacterium]
MDQPTNLAAARLSRRAVIKSAAAAAAYTLLPKFGPTEAVAAEQTHTLVIAAPATPQSLDHEFDVSLGTIDAVGALYDNLLEYEKIPDTEVPDALREDIAVHSDKPYNLNLKGKLAEKWEISSEGTVARFFLRQGVKSNWGNELTADDVKWTWDRKLHLTGLGPFQTGVLNITQEDQIQVEGRYVVSFHVPKPNPLLLKQMVNLSNPVYDSVKCKQVATKEDPWAHKFLENSTAGFGAYVVSQLVRGQQAVFKARGDYYRGKPYMDTVIFKEVPTSATRLSLLEGGSVDIAQFLQPLEYTTLKKVGGVSVDPVKASFAVWVELNAKMKPFDDVKVRQAMNYALPREEVLKTVFQELADKQTGCIPDIYPNFTDKFWTYDTDLDKAKLLLAEAGLKDGFRSTLSYDAGNPVQEPIAILFQTALRKIGVELTLNKVPAATFYDFVTKRQQPLIFYLDSPWVPDPGYSTQLYFNSKSYVDYSNYSNPEVDELIKSGLETLDPTVREQTYTKVQQIVMSEAPWAFIAWPRYVLARRSNLKGFTYYTSNNLRFQDFYRS